MAILKNRAGVVTSTTGTGTISLGAALTSAQNPNAASWQTFAGAGVANGDTVRYLILDSNGAWEYGPGVYSTAGVTLTRAAGSLNGSVPGQKSSTGALLTLSGTAQVFITAVDSDIVSALMSTSVPVSPKTGDLWYDLSTGVLSIYVNDGNSSQWVMVSPSGGSSQMTAPQGRLTLQTATPVMTTTQAAKTTIFYSQYVGNQIPLFDGTSMVMTTFAELSVATTDTTKSPAAIGASKVNDWFVWSDAGTVRIGHGPDWTSDTVRSAGTALMMVNGILINNVAITNGPAAQRGTYVGTTRSNASSQLDWILGSVAAGSAASAFFNVWNTYNRVDVRTFCGDTTDTWTTASPTYSQGSAAHRVSFVSGLAEDAFDASYASYCIASASSNHTAAIGYDVTNAKSGTIMLHVVNMPTSGSGARFSSTCLGFHFVAGIENSVSSATGTFGGDLGSPATYQLGFHFSMRM